MIDQNEPETAPLRRVLARSGRRRTAVLLVVALLAGGTWWVWSGGADDPETVAGEFAAAVADGDEQGAGALTDNPEGTASSISAMRIGLGSTASVRVRVLGVTDVDEGPGAVADGGGGGKRAALGVSWSLGEDRVWEYTTTAPLRRLEQGWRVVWSPAVLHPSLRKGDRVELRGLSPAAPRVLGAGGAVLMSQQTVTAVTVAVPAPENDLRAIAAVLAPLEVGVTGADLVDAARDRGSGALVAVTLREEPLARVRDRLRRIPGVTLRPERRLIAADEVRSPALVPALTDGRVEGADRGWQVARVDAEGRLVEQLSGTGPGKAEDVVVTLDRTRQVAARRAVDEVGSAAMLVAIRPSDGAVLAVAQNRAADAEGPVALTGLYPPGSTFKTVTAVSALQARVARPDTVLPCPGTENIEGRQIPNDDGFDIGAVPLHTAFARSCNTTFARLGVGLGPTALADTAASLGLGVDWRVPGLSAVTGQVPAARTPAERVEASIGQGRVLASPFGMALLAAGLADGTPPAPTFVAEQPGTVVGGAAPTGISSAVRDDLAAMMRETVTTGSAMQLADVDGLGGKTGTAQFGDGTRSHGWFIGTVGQDLAFAVVVTDAGSSRPAVAAAGTFLRAGGR